MDKDKEQVSTLLKPCEGYTTYRTSTGDNLDTHLTFAISPGGSPMDKSVFHSSQTNLVLIPSNRRCIRERTGRLEGDPKQKPHSICGTEI